MAFPTSAVELNPDSRPMPNRDSNNLSPNLVRLRSNGLRAHD